MLNRHKESLKAGQKVLFAKSNILLGGKVNVVKEEKACYRNFGLIGLIVCRDEFWGYFQIERRLFCRESAKGTGLAELFVNPFFYGERPLMQETISKKLPLDR